MNNISAFNGWRKQWVCPCVGFMNQESDTSGNWLIFNNLVWGNKAGNVLGQDSSAFVQADPMFADTLSFRPAHSSAAIMHADSLLTNTDGSPGELGAYGGPTARRK